MVRMLFVLIALLLVLTPAVAVAQEARCAEINAQGGICICSERMDTTTFTNPQGLDWTIGFPDGAANKCNYLGQTGAAGELNPQIRSSFFMSNTSSVITALTNTGVPSRVFSGVEGHTGFLLMGHTPLPGGGVPRT